MVKVTKGIRILLVDDDDDLRKILSFLLQKRGFITEEARDGKEGLEKIPSLKPDIIILDIVMPHIDGIQTCRILKGTPATQGIPIIFLSAQKEDAKLIGKMPGAAIEYMDKPCNFDCLITRIQSLINN